MSRKNLSFFKKPNFLNKKIKKANVWKTEIKKQKQNVIFEKKIEKQRAKHYWNTEMKKQKKKQNNFFANQKLSNKTIFFKTRNQKTK